MKFIRSVFDVFGYSPFEDLVRHAELCGRTIELLIEQFAAYKDGRMDEVKRIGKEIDKVEHEADLIKRKIMDKTSEFLVLPVDKYKLFNFLFTQDVIANRCETLAKVMSFKKVEVPEELWKDLEDILKNLKELVAMYEHLVNHTSSLLKTSFSKREVEEVSNHVSEIERVEEKLGSMLMRLNKKIFDLEPSKAILMREFAMNLIKIAKSVEDSARMFKLFMG